LTCSDVDEIRRLGALGGMTQKEIGKLFGVRQGHITKIINRTLWGDYE